MVGTWTREDRNGARGGSILMRGEAHVSLFNESFLIYKDIYSNLVQATLSMPKIKTPAPRSSFASGHPIGSSGREMIMNYCIVF